MNSISDFDKYLVNKLISIIFQVAMLELQSINNKLVTRKMLQQMSMLNSALNFEFFQSMWQLNVIPKKKESFHSGSKNCFQYTKEQLQPRNFLRNLSVLLIFLEVFFPQNLSRAIVERLKLIYILYIKWKFSNLSKNSDQSLYNIFAT